MQRIAAGKETREGDSLGPPFFNLIINEIIAMKDMKVCKICNTEFNIICYAHDAVLIAETEDDLQRLLNNFTMRVNDIIW